MFPRLLADPTHPRSSMRARLPLLPLVLLSFGCASASSRASASGDAERSLHARSDGLQAAESALDGTRATAFWATDAVIQPAGSPTVVGRDAIGALYRSFFSSGAIKEL